MFVYCLQCHSRQVKAIAARCEQIAGCRAINPLRIRHVRSRKQMIDLPAGITPGYLYLFTEEEPLPVDQVLRIKGVKGILGERADGYLLAGSEKDFALMLLKHGGTLGKTVVRCNGEHLSLLPDAFAPLSAEIVHVDRPRSTVQIQLNYGNPPFRFWVEYEVEQELPASGIKVCTQASCNQACPSSFTKGGFT